MQLKRQMEPLPTKQQNVGMQNGFCRKTSKHGQVMQTYINRCVPRMFFLSITSDFWLL